MVFNLPSCYPVKFLPYVLHCAPVIVNKPGTTHHCRQSITVLGTYPGLSTTTLSIVPSRDRNRIFLTSASARRNAPDRYPTEILSNRSPHSISNKRNTYQGIYHATGSLRNSTRSPKPTTPCYGITSKSSSPRKGMRYTCVPTKL